MIKNLQIFVFGLLIAIAGCGNKSEFNPSNFDSRTLTCAAYFAIALEGMRNGTGTAEQIGSFKRDNDDYLYLVMRKEHVIEKEMSDELREKNAKLFSKLTQPEGERLVTVYNTSREQMPLSQCMDYLMELQGVKKTSAESVTAPIAAITPSSIPAPVAATTSAATPAPIAATTPAVTPAPVAAVDTLPFTPSFDCAKAINIQEKMICADRELSKLDVNLSQAYSKAKEISTDKDKLKKEQLEWIRVSLRACSEKPCLITSYQKRISELQ